MPQPRPRVTRIEDVSGLCQMSPGGEGAGGKTAQCSEPGPGLPCPRSLLSGPAQMRHPRTNKLPLHPEYCTSNYTLFSVFLMRSAAPPAWMLANYGRTAERPEATEATPSSSSLLPRPFSAERGLHLVPLSSSLHTHSGWARSASKPAALSYRGLTPALLSHPAAGTRTRRTGGRRTRRRPEQCGLHSGTGEPEQAGVFHFML